MTRPRVPEFDALVGREASPMERARLHRVHELLVEADPPPELSPELEQVPWPDDALAPLGLIRKRRERGRRRPWYVYAAAAASLVMFGFLLGQVGGSRGTSLDVARVVKMHGIGAVSNATAAIRIGQTGSDGNWPMVVSVTNLPPASDGYYDLWLSKAGKPVFLCGSFNTRANAETIVRLSAAYPLERGGFDGWIVTRHIPGTGDRQSAAVMTT
jgi:hypothetical protein